MVSLDPEMRRDLGRLVRELRDREGLTLRALSLKVGVSQSALSQIESGKSEPALGTLWKLGGALNASLFDFFAYKPTELVDVTRGSDRTVVIHQRARYEAITKSANRKLDLFYLYLQPGDGAVRDPVTHAGEECGVVISGAMDVEVAGDLHRLEAGDGIWFDSGQPHTFITVGEVDCVSVWADSLPDHTPAPNLFEVKVDSTGQSGISTSEGATR